MHRQRAARGRKQTVAPVAIAVASHQCNARVRARRACQGSGCWCKHFASMEERQAWPRVAITWGSRRRHGLLPAIRATTRENRHSRDVEKNSERTKALCCTGCVTPCTQHNFFLAETRQMCIMKQAPQRSTRSPVTVDGHCSQAALFRSKTI